jgi:YidC/Oxa1 family membrane protein insertase
VNDNQPTSAARIVLFVGLAGLILILAQRFSTPSPPSNAPANQTPAAAVIGANPDSTARVGGDTARGAAVRNKEVDSVATVGAVPVESLTVADSISRYIFTNRGASVSSVELLRFKDLGGNGGSVQLLRSGDQLVRYHIVTAGDTTSLSDLTFASEVVRNSGGAVDRIRYTSSLPNSVRVTLDYTVVPNSYMVRLSGRLEGLTGKTFLVSEFPSGFRSGEADTLEDERHFAIAYKRAQADEKGIPFSKLDPGEKELSTTPVSWMALKSKYFIVGFLKPEGDSGFAQAQVIGGPRVSRAATHVAAYAIDDVSDGTFEFDIYAGPQEFNRLLAVGRDFQNSNPYGGWLQPVVQPFAILVMKALLWLRHSTNLSYGWVLVIFGVIVRLLLWPLNQRAMRTSMRLQRIQPELTEVQTKYKANPQKLQEEIMRVYRDHGMTPFSPLAGCLPMLIPMPVFFALFFVFQNTIEFRGVPFLWLPDISLKDPLYIVPIFMGVSMFVMSWMGSRSAPPNPQAKMMMYMLPVMMTVLFLNFASGLNLYYAVQNVAALPQQWLIARERKSNAKAVPAKKNKEKG